MAEDGDSLREDSYVPLPEEGVSITHLVTAGILPFRLGMPEYCRGTMPPSAAV